MLKLYRRHQESCPHTALSYIKCRCRLWVTGSLNGRWMRKSMDMTNWEDACRKVREWESGVKPRPEISVKQAVERYLEDAVSRHLAPRTMKKARFLLEKLLVQFCERAHVARIDQVTPSDIISFRTSWTNAPITSLKKFEGLRSFFGWCERNGFSENPCRGLKPPKVSQKPTEPFTDEEMKNILEACEKFCTSGRYQAANRTRVKAMSLLLRYSGLRLGDAITLERSRLKDGKLFLRTAKTGTSVYVPLPKFVVKEVESLNHFPDRFFWNGHGSLQSALTVWCRTMKTLFRLAGLPDAHCHMFRNTFAVALLQAAVPIEDVAILLGHQDVKVTWRCYSPFVKARQDRLEERVKASWN